MLPATAEALAAKSVLYANAPSSAIAVIALDAPAIGEVAVPASAAALNRFVIVGAASVLVLLLAIAWRIFGIARAALVEERTFGAFVAYGAGFVIAIQTLISVGVNTGTLPTKGLTLPFISYGGNSLLMCCGLLGLSMRVDMERGRRDR